MSIRRAVAGACLVLLGLAGSAALGAPTASGSALLFSYFIGNGEDGLHLAWSEDGLEWTALNGGRSCLTPTVGEEPEATKAGLPAPLIGVGWFGLAEVPERDRAYLWAAGLLAVQQFRDEVDGWSDDVSYPGRRAAGV